MRGQMTPEEMLRMREFATQQQAAREFIEQRNRQQAQGIGLQVQ